MEVINLASKLAGFEGHWQPRTWLANSTGTTSWW